MMRTPTGAPQSKLRLHRDTLGTLTVTGLQHVAGGTSRYPTAPKYLNLPWTGFN
jgi:hypothetical protein